MTLPETTERADLKLKGRGGLVNEDPVCKKEQPMSEDEQTGRQDAIERLLTYDGPSLRQERIEKGLIIADYRNSDENERNITKLLSSQGVPFHLERPQSGLPGREIRMYLTIPEDRYEEAKAILEAAVSAGVVEIIEGTEDLISR